MNRRVILVRRPEGKVTESCFEVTETPRPEIGAGGALLEVRYLGIDPTIRGWLNEGGNYMPGVAIGEVVRSNGVGVVVETDDAKQFPLGAWFMGLTGWQQYWAIAADEFPPVTMIAAESEPMDALNVQGQVGLTAYFGVVDVGQPQAGETFVVSAAASGVGSIAGQIAKLRGARVVGIAGGPAKCAWVVDELGFDACIDYKNEDVTARLRELAPQGIDVFFDNVGGALLDTVLRRIAVNGRIVLCGDISTYDIAEGAVPVYNLKYVMGRRARMQGFNTFDSWDRYGEATEQLGAWAAEGKITGREHVLDGLERAPEALVRLFAGDHLGKLVVKVT